MSERMAAGGGLNGWLFGRWTYVDLLAIWNARGGPFKDALNDAPKYVVSNTLEEPPRWPNSTLLGGAPLRRFGPSRPNPRASWRSWVVVS